MKPFQTPPKASFHLSSEASLISNTKHLSNSYQISQYVIEQHRKLEYSVSLHQHPYVQPLMKRLIKGGVSGLQAVDTEFAADEVSVPYGVDLQLEKGTGTILKSGTKLALLTDVLTQDPIGNNLQLHKGDELTLAADAAIRIFAGTRLILTKAMKDTPYPQAIFNLSENRTAAFFVDTPIELVGATQFIWAKDKQITLPANQRAVSAVATEFEIAKDTEVKVLRRNMQPSDDFYSEFFENAYQPNSDMVRKPYPVKDLDFTSSGAYSAYNWELFYHVPLTMAMHLSKNQRFAEAQKWFHYIFDPTDSSNGPTPERFWKVRPFQYTDVQTAEEILVNLSTNADPSLKEDTINSIDAWKDKPFRPHVVARYRQQSYMFKTVMAYLDNLIAWGDSLFRMDTGEAIDEATQIYVMAANILGTKPLPVPKKGSIRPQNYANIRDDLNEFGNVLREMEASVGFDLIPLAAAQSGTEERIINIQSLGKSLYFCVPRNDKMLSYWDTIADRLFKIRNSLNFQGIFRQLALFEPPIDPALLARAAAAGLDISSVVNGLNQPLPLVRFVFLVQKAAEIVQEVKSLGNNLLSAMEKEDGETMALLRAKHERAVMEMVEKVKYGQLQEAIKAKEGSLQNLSLAVQRYTYYEKQLGKKADEIDKSIPELNELKKDERDSLISMKFVMSEPVVNSREIDIDIAQDLGESGGKIVSSHEAIELSKLSTARDIQDIIRYARLSAQGFGLIPDFSADLHFWGLGGHTDIAGGTKLSHVASFAADVGSAIADHLIYEAGNIAKIGSYARREQDWAFQSNLAAGEINQIFKQLRAAQIREAIAELELKNHRAQIKHAREIEQFLNEEGTEKTGKKTNKALYTWMKREVKGLYSQCFQFAYDIAKKAERALQHELGNTELSYLQYGYLAGKEGLLAGEKLYLDIKRMEMAYHDQNQREYELTKHISLLQVNPLALIQLRTTGRCTVDIPEDLFDMDGPGHYFRRIKTVAVSIPCVTGPYASVNCTLTLLKSSIRKTQILRDDKYTRDSTEDDRFSDHFGSLQSIVTSSAQNDSGLFETNLRDERYLPFENSGVIGTWQLQLPCDLGNKNNNGLPQFDYQTISDVILHVRYTAREGGGLLRNGSLKNLANKNLVRLFSIREEFPEEWYKFDKADKTKRRELVINFHENHFPFWFQSIMKRNNEGNKKASKMEVIVMSSSPSVSVFDDISPEIADPAFTLTKDSNLGGAWRGTVGENLLPVLPSGSMKLYFFGTDIKDIWTVVSV